MENEESSLGIERGNGCVIGFKTFACVTFPASTLRIDAIHFTNRRQQ